MKAMAESKPIYTKLTITFVIIATWFFPGSPSSDGYGMVFGYPFKYLTFYEIGNTLWNSTGVNLLFLYLDYYIIFYVIKAIGNFIKSIISKFSKQNL